MCVGEGIVSEEGWWGGLRGEGLGVSVVLLGGGGVGFCGRSWLRSYFSGGSYD